MSDRVGRPADDIDGLSRDSVDQTLFLINPHRFPGYARKLKRILKNYRAPNMVECADAAEFRRRVEEFAAGDLRYLLIWGGDGTANLAINTYMNASGKRNPHEKGIGFLRGGSGNGIQDSYEVPWGIRRQLSALGEGMEHGYLQPVDLIAVDDGRRRTFCQILGVGLDAQILVHREGRGRGRPGLLNYLVSSVVAWGFDFERVRQEKRIQMHEGKYAFRGTRSNAEFPFREFERITRSPLIEIATRPYYAKMFKIAPDVVCNDGLCDLYSFNFHRRRDFLFNLPGIWLGWHSRINRLQARRERPVIERYEVKRVSIAADEGFPYHVDGELRHCPPGRDSEARLTAEIVPSALRFIVPASFYLKFHPFDDDRLRDDRRGNR